jgi:uncharacterized membrane protein
MNKMSIFFIVLAGILLCASTASAVNMQITDLKVDSFSLNPAVGHTDNLEVERGQDIQIKIRVKALATVQDAQVEANIFGYRYSTYEEAKVSDTTKTFDLNENDTAIKTLNLQIPTLIDQDYFKLRIRVADRDSVSFENVYELHVVGIDSKNAVYVKDFTLSPQAVMAGRAFTASVQVKNIGNDDMKDLKATVSVPSLGIQDVEYLDELKVDDSKVFEKLLLRVPECTAPGDYSVKINVDFDEYETTESEGKITVVADSACNAPSQSNNNAQGKTTIRVPQSQDVAAGATVAFPIVIENTKNVPQTYTLKVSGVTFGTARIDPGSLMVVNGNDIKTAYVYIAVNPTEKAGEKVFAVSVDTDSESKQIPLTVNVTPASSGMAGLTDDSLRRSIEVGLVILVIVLIIVGLIIGFTRLKDQKKTAETEPYY